MPAFYADDVMESSETTGLGPFSLGGAEGTYQTFAQRFADGAEVIYRVSNADRTKWEELKGVLTYGTPNTLSRGAAPLASSNAGAAIDWQSSDTKILYQVADADALANAASGNSGTTRPATISTGASWWDTTAGVAVSWIRKLVTGPSTDVRTGFYDAVKALFFPDNRKRSVAVGATNKTFAAVDIGGSFTFDTTAGARTATLPAHADAGVGDGYHFEALGLSAANGVILTPAAGDGIDGGADAATKTIPGGVLFTVRWSNADDRWVTNYKAAAATVFAPMTLYGLAYSNNVADATNDIDIAAGGAMDATGAYWITLSAITKRLDAAWAVGTNQGGLDTGAIGNSDYFIWAIGRTDGTVNDVLFSLSATAPTMPANYTFKRLIGWFKRVSATIVPFHTFELEGGGIEQLWDAPTLDISKANSLTTARTLDAVKVPVGIQVEALVRVMMSDAAATFLAVVCSPNEADGAPSNSVVPLANIVRDTGGTDAGVDLAVRVDTSGRIAARATLATVDFYGVLTRGFRWSRR